MLITRITRESTKEYGWFRRLQHYISEREDVDLLHLTGEFNIQRCHGLANKFGMKFQFDAEHAFAMFKK
jgi:hypothetical protein